MSNTLIHYRNYELYWHLTRKSRKYPRGRPMTHRIQAVEGFPRSDCAEMLFQQFGLVFLISHELPTEIRTDFPVLPSVRVMIGKMYERCERPVPKFIGPPCPEEPHFILSEPLQPNRAVHGNSGGKDSAYTVLRLCGDFGRENVFSVHLRNLSTEGVAHREWPAAVRVADFAGVRHNTTNLRNSTCIPGRRIMNSRDIFLLAMLAAHAIENRAQYIAVEGPVETARAHARFSSLKTTYDYLQATLNSWGLDVHFRWYPEGAYETLRRLYADPAWRDIMPRTHSCYTENRRMSSNRRSHARRTPKLGQLLYDGQCGSCFKCRIITLARMLFDRNMDTVPRAERATYLNRTQEWRQSLLASGWNADFTKSLSLIRLIDEVGEKLKE